MAYNRIFIAALFFTAPGIVSAQWVSGDGQVLEERHKNISKIEPQPSSEPAPAPKAGAGVPGVEVYVEDFDTPAVYAPSQDKIDALRLNDAQLAALKAQFPEFVPWTLADYGGSMKYYPFSKRQMPYALSLDFTGKGLRTTVVAGHDKERNFVAILLPAKNGYRVFSQHMEFFKAGAGRELSTLMLIRKDSVSKISYGCEPDTSQSRHTAFIAENHGVSSDVPPEQHFQDPSSVDLLAYYHEGLSNISSGSISGMSPQAEPRPGEGALTPTAEMRKALIGYDKDFKIWESTDYPTEVLAKYRYSEASMPYAVKADLNGDGVPDMVVAGHDNDSNLMLELISDSTGYYVQKVGGSEPCYRSARERGEKLAPKPGQILSLYKKGKDFKALSPVAGGGYSQYNDAFLVGARAVNSCLKTETKRTLTNEEVLAKIAEEDATHIVDDVCPKYAGWNTSMPLTEESYFFYTEAPVFTGLDCNGSDSCSLELFPPGSPAK